MSHIIVKTLGFILMIVSGYVTKKLNLLKREDSTTISNIIMNITLPCALITGMNASQIDSSILILLIIGLLSNICLILVAKYRARKQSLLIQGMEMINTGGYNVGNYAIPFAASFFPGSALSYLCMFDVGNSIMCLGGTMSIAKGIINGEKGISIKRLVKSLASSLAFDTYIIMVILSMCHISLPVSFVDITGMIGGANSFLAMLMLGIILEPNMNKSILKSVTRIISTRYIVSVLIGMLVYFFLPVPLLAKQMTIIVLLSPMSNVNAVYSKSLGCDEDVPAMVTTVSIFISTILMTISIILFTV